MSAAAVLLPPLLLRSMRVHGSLLLDDVLPCVRVRVRRRALLPAIPVPAILCSKRCHDCRYFLPLSQVSNWVDSRV